MNQSLILEYRGELPSGQKKGARRRLIISAIRQQVHEQLRHFPHGDHSACSNQPRFWGPFDEGEFTGGVENLKRHHGDPSKIPIEIGPFEFIPIYARSERFRPELRLNIQLYSSASSWAISEETGDIDNRVKLLIDALQAPSTKVEANAEDWKPDDGPCWTLMEDDSFIRDLSIRQTKSVGDPHSSEVLAIITSTNLSY